MSRILEIPLLEPGSFLTIDVGTDLADDPTEVCQLLADEKCAPKWWLAIAAAYARRLMLQPASEVVSSGLAHCSALKDDEQRAPFHAMLSWLSLAQMRRAETSIKRENYDRALQSGNRAFNAYQDSSQHNINQISVPAVLAQGALYSAVGNLNDAFQCFQTVLASQPQNVYAKLGRARVLYSRKNFRGALKLYQEVLKQCPRTQPGNLARVGLGVCFYRLGDRVKAKKAWQRAIDVADLVLQEQAEQQDDKSEDLSEDAPHLVDPTQSHGVPGVCNALLGISELSDALQGPQESFAGSYSAAIEHFQVAYKQGVTALPALKIAAYLFSKHDMARMTTLTDIALATATKPELLGEAMFWKARAAHYANELELAHTLYSQASAADPENVAASIGKSIVELSQDRAPEALLTLEIVAQKHPKNAAALLYSGLFSVQTEPQKARGLLESYVTAQRLTREPLKYEALVTLAQLWEKIDPNKALSYLRLAQAAVPSTPKELRINLGVLAFKLRDFAEAELQFSSIEDSESDWLVRFNLARAREALGKDVVDEYKEIGQHLFEARARLTLMSESSLDAINAAQKLVEQFPSNTELRALLAYHLRRTQSHGQLDTDSVAELSKREQQVLISTLSDHDKHDTYALVALANVYLRNAVALRNDRAKQKSAFIKATELFEKALQVDVHNAYAAQGIAIALASTKQAKIAQSVFSRLRETLIGDLATTINGAHCLMDVGDFARASELYGLAYDQKPSSGLAALLGWSWYARGCRTKDIKAMFTSLEWTLKANEDSETETGQFNLALVQMQLGDVIRRKPSDQRTLEQLELASKAVTEALATFQKFAIDSGSLPFNNDDLDEKADIAEHTILPELTQAITDQREYERKSEEKRQLAVKQREEELKIVQEAKKREEEDRIERENQLAAERLRLQQETLELEAQRQAERRLEVGESDVEDKPKKKGKKGKKGKSKKAEDSDDEDDNNPPPLESEDEKEFDESKLENEPETERKVERKTTVDDDDSEDEAEAEAKPDDEDDGLF